MNYNAAPKKTEEDLSIAVLQMKRSSRYVVTWEKQDAQRTSLLYKNGDS